MTILTKSDHKNVENLNYCKVARGSMSNRTLNIFTILNGSVFYAVQSRYGAVRSINCSVHRRVIYSRIRFFFSFTLLSKQKIFISFVQFSFNVKILGVYITMQDYDEILHLYNNFLTVNNLITYKCENSLKIFFKFACKKKTFQ